MKVSSSVTGAMLFGNRRNRFSVRLWAVRSTGASENRLEVIVNGLGGVENGLELTTQGRRYEVEWFGSRRKWFGTDRAGEEDRGPVVWN
jgi:hypothetical protein